MNRVALSPSLPDELLVELGHLCRHWCYVFNQRDIFRMCLACPQNTGYQPAGSGKAQKHCVKNVFLTVWGSKWLSLFTHHK